MQIRKHPFKHKFVDGDILTDIEFNEIFVFNEAQDGLRAILSTGNLRYATEEEVEKLKTSKKTSIPLAIF